MVTVPSSSSSTSNRPTYSCIRCADRKVKCDRQRPSCTACVKHNADCVFNPTQPPRKRYKRVKDQILIDRLKYYEALLQEQGIDPSKLPDPPNSEPCRKSSHTATVIPEELPWQTTVSVESEPSRCISKTQVIHGQGHFRVIDNSLWTRVVEEFYDPDDALEGSSNDASDIEASDDDFSFVLSHLKSNTRGYHPPPEHIYQLWQLFIENVDPLTKVVHVPTLQSTIHKAVSNIETIPRGFEALMFAIYGAAVVSLKDDECKQKFYEPRKVLLSRYISATKAALSQAKFTRTTSLVVLQALVLHLVSVRDIYAPRSMWCLTGLAVRIAQGMGLERDGTFLGLPPFETEIRRRIWWLIKSHDFRAAELCGLPKFRDLDTGAESTKWPTNVNDNQLYPGMPSLVVESSKLTDMVFVASKYELTNFAAGRIAIFRRQGKNSSQWDTNVSGSDKREIDEALRELEEILETKYLRYCDPSKPLHLLTMLVARYAANVVRFLTHHPRRWASIERTPLSERQWVWEISVKLLEQQNMLQSNPQLKQFSWHAAFFQQWHAFIHVLDTLRANPLIADAEKAWQLIGNIYENTPDMIFDTKKPIYVAVGNLCLRAYSDHEAALLNGNACLPPVPEFILQLRQQREVAKVKRQARDAKNSQPEDSVSHNQADARDVGTRPDAGVIYLSDTLEATFLQQSTTSHSPSLPQMGSTTEGDSFWFNRFDDSQVGNLDSVMNMDPDFMLIQDHSVEDNATQNISWEQWDAWLTDTNAKLLPNG